MVFWCNHSFLAVSCHSVKHRRVRRQFLASAAEADFPTASPHFDTEFAARRVLGRHWRGATPEQRKRFVDAFYNSLLRKYADGLLEFDQDRIEILPFRGDPSRKQATVKTNVTLNDGTEVPVHYQLAKRDDGWLMFDVKVEGISYVTNYRKEFDAEIRTSSLMSVIERLEAEVSAGSEAPAAEESDVEEAGGEQSEQ